MNFSPRRLKDGPVADQKTGLIKKKGGIKNEQKLQR
jgi:hypothetical protein